MRRSAHQRLQPYVTEYAGYHIEGAPPGVHAGLPSRSLTLIIALDEPIDVEHRSVDRPCRSEFWGLIGGLHRRPSMVHHEGRQVGIQLDITPHGAQALFGVPAAVLANHVLDLDDIMPGVGLELVDRLNSAESWERRWAILDDVLLGLLTDGAHLRVEIEAMWSMLVSTNGTIGVEQIATELGWSRRHLSKHFMSSFGLNPKTMARVIRFERANRLLRLPSRPSLSTLAHVCGYADQAHMTRDWSEFAGSSPSQWLRNETIPILQDQNTAISSP